MPKQEDLTDDQFRFCAGVLLGIVQDERAIANRREPATPKNNTERINEFIDSNGLDGWDRRSVGGLMNKMRAAFAVEGTVGCFPDGKEKRGPSRFPESIAVRMRRLGIL